MTEPEDAAVARRVRELLGKKLGPEEATEIALLRNQRLLGTYQRLGIAQADLVQAGLLANPSVGGAIGFPLGGSPHTSLTGSLAEDFLSLFTLPLRKRFATLELAEAKEHVGAAVLDLAADVHTAFNNLQAAEKIAELWQTLAAAEGASAELSDRQYKAGNISELDALSRRGAYEQMRLESVRAGNEVLEARETLNRLMGLWGSEIDWKISEGLPSLPQTEIPLEHLEAAAIASRLDLAAARTDTELAAQALSLAAGTRFFTHLTVGVQGERDSEGNKLVGPTLNLELPIFDQHQAQIAALQARARAARAREDELSVAIRSEVRVARNRLLTARIIVEQHQSVLLPLRTRILKLSQQRYNAMLLGVYTLLQAKQDEVSAYRGYILAVRDYWNASSELQRIIGRRVAAATSRKAP